MTGVSSSHSFRIIAHTEMRERERERGRDVAHSYSPDSRYI